MASETLSFRITRHTEDLAQTIHALSQRLVKLEQRLAAMELQLDRQQRADEEGDPEHLSCLESVERLLADCRELLEVETVEPLASSALSGRAESDSPSVSTDSEFGALAA